MEDDAIVSVIPEPHDIDGPLEHRVPIWVARNPTNVEILYAYVTQCVADGNAMGRTRCMKVMLVTRACASLTLWLMLAEARLVLNPKKLSTI